MRCTLRPAEALLAVALASITAAPSSSASASGSSASAPPGVDRRIHVRIILPNASGVPGEKKSLEATVESSGPNPAPLDGLTVKFEIGGFGPVGSASSKNGGRVSVPFTIPDSFVQKANDLKASIAEDSGHHAAQASAKLLVVKAETEIRLGDLIWGTYRGAPGSPSGSYTLSLLRRHDGKALQLPVKVTVNSASYNTVDGSAALLPLPPGPATWKVEARFEGNESYITSYGTKTYVKPK